MNGRGRIRTALSLGSLALAVATASAQSTTQAAPAVRASGAEVQGFSVVLVAGSLQSGTEATAAGVPRGAAKALADMADFLPFKHYRLLDTAWVLNSGSGRFASRMRGPEGQVFDVVLETAPAAARVGVKFELRGTRIAGEKIAIPRADHALPEVQAEREALKKDLVALESELAQLRKRVGPQHADTLIATRKYEELRRRHEVVAVKERVMRDRSADAPIVDTNFTMDIGETVVVGTSRLQGDTALIVLLTAVPRATK